jgi:hypothetical protein
MTGQRRLRALQYAQTSTAMLMMLLWRSRCYGVHQDQADLSEASS